MGANQYLLDPEFEAAVIMQVSSNPEFYGKYGYWLDPAMFTSEAGKIVVKAARLIFNETGRGPTNDAQLFQRMQSWVNEGKIKADLIAEIGCMIDEAWEDGWSAGPVATEIKPMLQKFHRQQALDEMLKAHAREENLIKQCAAIERAATIGEVTVSTGVKLGPQSMDAIRDLKNLERMRTGIYDLDHGMGGGLARASMTLWVGDTGDGKSMALSQMAATGLMSNLNVVYVTLEIPVAYVFARTKAALTGYMIDDFINCDPDAEDAIDELMPDIGSMYCEWMEPGFTTADNIKDYVDRIQDRSGRQVDMICVDYMDRVVPARRKRGQGREVSSYSAGELVGIELRDGLFVPYNVWGHTAAQATRSQGGKKRMKGVHDVADSMHKVRIADAVITLNAREEASGDILMTLRQAKNRVGKSNFSVGPEPAEYEVGLVYPSEILYGGEDPPDYSAAL